MIPVLFLARTVSWRTCSEGGESVSNTTLGCSTIHESYGNHDMTMTRRDFLSASAAFAAAPALSTQAWSAPLPRDADIVVIGAGAAGIAAARRIMAANRKVIVIEATGRVGGRCLTDSTTFDVPFDLGARWMHNPETNPMIKLARYAGLDISPAPLGQKIRIGRRYARAGEAEEFLAALVRAKRAIEDAARGKADASCASVLPADLGDWARTEEFMLGANATGKDLSDISVIDKARAQDRNAAIACRQGLGTLIARLARAAAAFAVDAGQPHRLERTRCHGGNAGRQDRRARRHRHGVEQRADRGHDQVHSGHPQAPARCRGEVEPRQLRPYCLAIAGQSARARARRHPHRAEQFDTDGAAVRQYRADRRCARSTSPARSAASSRRRASGRWSPLRWSG